LHCRHLGWELYVCPVFLRLSHPCTWAKRKESGVKKDGGTDGAVGEEEELVIVLPKGENMEQDSTWFVYTGGDCATAGVTPTHTMSDNSLSSLSIVCASMSSFFMVLWVLAGVLVVGTAGVLVAWAIEAMVAAAIASLKQRLLVVALTLAIAALAATVDLVVLLDDLDDTIRFLSFVRDDRSGENTKIAIF
jgi:hypothetical protein